MRPTPPLPRAAALTPLLALLLAPAARAEELVLSGLVLDRPPPGAQAEPAPARDVELSLELKDAGEPRTLHATTDAEGRFRLPLPERGARPLRVLVSAPESATHRGARSLRTLEAGEGGEIPFRLERMPHGALEGLVRDLRGRPLADAGVFAAADEDQPAVLLAHTDAAGRFRLEPFRGGALRAELAGHAASEELEPDPLARGGWRPFELVLAPAGDLELRVRDSGGRGRAELELELRPLDPRAPALERWDGTRAWRWTGADGRALFEEVWAGTPLELVVWSEDGEEWSLTRCAGPLLVPASDPDGRPIVAEPSGRTALELRLGAPLVVRGRVLTRGGRPLDRRCYAHLVEVDPPADRTSPTSQRRARVDDEGRFELCVYAEPGLGRLLLGVGSRSSLRVGTLALALVDPRDARDGVLELELTAAQGLSLRGRLRGLGGASDEYSLRAVPSGLSRVQAQEHVGRDRPLRPFSDGSFAIDELAAGRYDLIVQERTGCIGSVVARFADLPAGGGELELELPAARDVRVRVRALAPEGEVGSMLVLAGRAFPVIAREPADGPPSSSYHEPDPDPWPAAVPPTAGRITTVESAEALTVYRAFQATGSSFDLPPTGAGWYVFGVHARRADGRPFAPVVSAPIGLGPGFHEIALELRRTADVVGRIVGGEASGEELYVELRDHRDRLVPARRSMLSFSARLPVQRDGDFRLREVPLGWHRLWVGSEEELDEGRFRRELLVEVREESEPLEVRIPRATD